MGFDDDRSGARFDAHRDVVVCRRAFPGEGPAAQGPRARRNWPSPRASVSVLRPQLLPSPSPPRSRRGATPERGQMLRRAVCETASNRFPAAARVARPRAWSSARRSGTPFGVRRPPSIRPRGLLSGCSLPPAADRSRRLSAPREVSRPLAGRPSRPLCPSDISPASGGNPRFEEGVRDARWLAVRRGTDASRSGNWASHASARPSRPCTGHPIR